MTPQTAFLLIYTIVLILICGFSFLIHERWKENDDLNCYCGRFLRILLGLISWINAFVIFADVIQFLGGEFHLPYFVLTGPIGIGLMLIPFFKSKKDGNPAVFITAYAVLASMGTYVNLFLIISIVGLFFRHLMKKSSIPIPLPEIKTVTRGKETVQVLHEDGSVSTLEDYSVSEGTKRIQR